MSPITIKLTNMSHITNTSIQVLFFLLKIPNQTENNLLAEKLKKGIFNMSNLKLITTESFGDLSCNFYRNMNDDILLNREQIGFALEYANPQKAIQKIHSSHKDRLEPLCIRIVENRVPHNGGIGVDVETVYYTERGIMEICRWSRQRKANQFMDWVWDVIQVYRNNELQPQVDMTIYKEITTTLSLINDRLTKLEESENKKKLPEKKYSRWKTNTFSKLYILQEYVNTHSNEVLTLPNIISLVIKETEDVYNIELNEYVELYKSEFSLETNPYAIDVINHYKDIRDMFTLTLDSIMQKLRLSDPKPITPNIFDILAEEINRKD